MGDKDLLSSESRRKIVKQTRNTIFMSDENGNVSKYQLVKEPEPKKNTTAMTKAKESKRNLEKMVSALPKCTVVVKKLSQADIDKIIAEAERRGKIRIIGEKIKKLPLMKIMRAVQLIIQNEPKLDFSTSDDIDLNLVSDNTLFKLQQLVCSNGLPNEKLPFSGRANVMNDTSLDANAAVPYRMNPMLDKWIYTNNSLQSNAHDEVDGLQVTDARLNWIYRSSTIKIKVSGHQGQADSVFFIAPEILELVLQSIGSEWFNCVYQFILGERINSRNAMVKHCPKIDHHGQDETEDGMISKLIQLFQNNWFSTDADEHQIEMGNTMISNMMQLFKSDWFSDVQPNMDNTGNDLRDFEQTSVENVVVNTDENYAEYGGGNTSSGYDADSSQEICDTSAEDGNVSFNLDDKLYRLYHGRDNDAEN